ncbi:hypothetical protein G7Y79_00005g016470 [Physcia stellaris]|nr:hypothetical protein G7Y79_00005g016470 [Physcia stellaris]
MAPRKVASKVSKLTADYVVEKLPLREYAVLFNNNKFLNRVCAHVSKIKKNRVAAQLRNTKKQEAKQAMYDDRVVQIQRAGQPWSRASKKRKREKDDDRNKDEDDDKEGERRPSDKKAHGEGFIFPPRV